MPPIRELVHVSAGLNEDGGGTAHLGRLSGRVLRRFAARRGLVFRGLHLPATDGSVAADGYRSFGGSRIRLSAALLGHLIASRGRAAYFFDHIGPARALAVVPKALLPRYAVQLHGIEIWNALSADRRRVLIEAPLLVANSSYTAARFAATGGSTSNVRVVPLGAEEPHRGGVADPALLDDVGHGYALIVGRMAAGERYKGHDELLDCWSAVRARLPEARLVVAGAGSDLERLRQKASTLGLDAAVKFTGRVDSSTLSELYRRATLFAMPSREEGFGLVFVEAMAARLPCIALDGTAPAEIVVDGGCGRLVPAGNPEALAAAVGEILGDAEKSRVFGDSARRRYEAHFTRERFEARLEPVLADWVAN